MRLKSKLTASAAAPRARRSLRGELQMLVLISVGVSVGLVAGVSAWRDSRREADLEADRLHATAVAIGSVASEATAAGDKSKALGALRPIAQMPGVLYARIEDPAGRLLVETGSGARLLRDVEAGVGDQAGLFSTLTSRTFEVTAPVTYARVEVGKIVLLARSEGALGLFLSSLLTSVAAAIAAVFAGLLAAAWLQRSLTRPIVALTRSMREVERDHDYSRSVAIKAYEEFGELVDGFNLMLEEARRREATLERDVAERTAELSATKNLAEHANSAKSDFLATMSHEIRIPMKGIMGMAEKLAACDMPPRRRRFAEVIARSGSSLLATIDDILELSKIEAGKMDLESEPVDLCEVVEDVCSLFWDEASSKGLDLSAYVDPATPRLILGDPTRLRQIVGNLVNNAIKFTEAGGVLIEIEPDAEASLRISVRDTGVGIPKDKIGTVVGAFTPADPSTTRKFGGAGLGLAIYKKLVEAMGGRFQVTSQVGRGSTFAFRLPVTVVEAAAPWPAAPAERALAVVAHTGVSTRRALGRYLARAGYAVGPKADAITPALVLGAAQSLRALGPSAVPAVCLGEFGDSAPSEAQREGLAQAVLIQPFRRRDLEDLLGRLARGETLRDSVAESDPDGAAHALKSLSGALVSPLSGLGQTASTEERALLADLEAALATDQLSMVYQPQMDRDGDQVLGVEALIRWTHPQRGFVSPVDFIPLAERHGLIRRVTDWVVERVIAESDQLETVPIAFNVSAAEFKEADFVGRMLARFDRPGVEKHRFEIEITETVVLDEEAQVVENIRRLHEHGFRIALDDFGAGHTSLRNLRRIPFDKLKIDREFVSDCIADVQSASLVHAVVSIGRALGMKVVAEGVETELQRKFLRVAGVHAMQGYLFSKPVSIQAVEQMRRGVVEPEPLRAAG